MVLEPASDGIGMRFEELWPPKMVEKLKPAILETARSGTPYENEVILRGDGGIRHAFRMRGFAIPDDRVVIAFEETTEQRRAEDVVEQARRDMDLVLNATSDFLAYYSLDHTVQWVNRAAMREIGKPIDQIVGRPCYDVWHCAGQNESTCAVRRVAETGRPSDVRVKTPSGQTFVVRAYPAFDDGRLVGVVESTVDITASVRAREERQQMEAQLRQSQKLESIGTLASGIAHEVNNPLTGMVNYAELIAMRVQDDSLRAYAEGIREEGARVAAIVRNLLSFARADSGETVAVPPACLVETTLLLVRALLSQDGIDLRIDVPDDLPCVRCRPQQIEQVLLNLLTNARDALNERFPDPATPEKWLVLRGRAVDEVGAPGVRLTVEDNGPGIPEALRERVFDPFFTTKPRDRGTGLGLSISYGIVRDHGGRLWIESPPAPRGATAVHIDLPAVSTAGENQSAGGGAG
jgi:signal transduction histidine kinase